MNECLVRVEEKVEDKDVAFGKVGGGRPPDATADQGCPLVIGVHGASASCHGHGHKFSKCDRWWVQVSPPLSFFLLKYASYLIFKSLNEF